MKAHESHVALWGSPTRTPTVQHLADAGRWSPSATWVVGHVANRIRLLVVGEGRGWPAERSALVRSRRRRPIA